MTEGMLMREYLADNNLSKYICIILDEAHEGASTRMCSSVS